MKTIRRFYREYVLRHWGTLLIAFLLTATGNQAPYAFSMLGKWLVDDVLQIGGKGKAKAAEVKADTPVASEGAAGEGEKAA